MSEETIFAIALEKHTPAERAAYVDEACAGDSELRRRVEALLGSHEEAGGFLDAPAADEYGITQVRGIAEGPNTRIGPYKLLEQIGEGGMGVVYLAEQREPIRRRVALKIIKPGMDTAEVIARFETERQALAIMDHENIARVLDGGTTESGRPYFVMELVKGVPITKYCDQHSLATPARLELFIAVCQAVQHAHQKGIIHRDIKPSNVLVAVNQGKPLVKVIDFGVAKATTQRLTEKTLFTRQGQLVGTLQYMSPEQASLSGLDVDTRSDIYSLGVLLYELLTGTTPLDQQRLREAAFSELQRIIREEEPPKPSTRVSESGDSLPSIAAHRGIEPQKLGRLLRGELDWIVMKSLEKDRTRRYESATGFARDIQRYLSDEPVEAGPPLTSYRLSKFALKHRKFLLTLSSFVVVLLAATINSSWLAFVANRDRIRAVAAEREALNSEDLARSSAEAERQIRFLAQQLEQAAIEEMNAAKKARDTAFAATEEAKEAYRQAEVERDRAQRAAAKEANQRRIAETNVYLSRIALAYRAWQSNDVRHTVQLLSACVPKSGELDCRHWEWHYLLGLCHSELLRLADHRGPVFHAAYSSDGRFLASAGGGNPFYSNPNHKVAPGEVIIWDAEQGQLLHRLRGHEHLVTQVAFSPDGETIASGSYDQSIKIWSTKTGQVTHTIHGSSGPVQAVMFSPDGRTLVSAGGRDIAWETDNHVYGWNPQTGELLWTLDGCGAPIAFHPDGQTLAATSGYRRIRFWDIATRRGIRTLEGQSEPIHGLAFSPDGTMLATAGETSAVRVWDTTTGKIVHTLDEHDGTVQAVAFDRTGKLLATAGDDTTVRIWDTSNWREHMLVRGHVGVVNSLAFDPVRHTLASASSDTTIKTWDLTRDQRAMILGPFSAPKADLNFRDEGRTLVAASASSQYGVTSYDISTGKMTCQYSLPVSSRRQWPRNDFAISGDGKLLAAPAEKDLTVVKVWDTAGGNEVLTFAGHQATVTAVAFSPDGKWVASAARTSPEPGVPCEIKVWEIASGNELKTILLKVPSAELIRKTFAREESELRRQLEENPDQATAYNNLAWFLTTCPDSSLWKADEAVCLAKLAVELEPDRYGVWNTLGVAYYRANNDTKAIEALEQSVARIGDNEFGLFFVAMAQHRLGEHQVASETFERAVALMKDNSPSDAELLRFRAEAAHLLEIPLKAIDEAIAVNEIHSISILTFSPDGQQIAFAGLVKDSVHVWNVATAKPMLYLQGDSSIDDLVFSPDGGRLAGASREHGTRMWDAATGTLLFNTSGPSSVHNLCFSPDGQRLATVGYAGDVQLLDARTGQEIMTLRGRARPPGTRGQTPRVTYSPDGQRLAAFTPDDTINVWDAAPTNSQLLSARRASIQERAAASIYQSAEQQAQAADRSEQFELALRNWEYLVQLQPNRPEWLVHRGEAHARLGHWQAAAADYAAAHAAGVLHAHNELVAHAMLRLVVRDAAGYRQACTELLERYGNDDDEWRILMNIITAVAGDGVVNADNRSWFFKMVEQRVPKKWKEADNQSVLRAAVEYRCGNYQETFRQIESIDWSEANSYRALALFRSGDLNHAGEWLKQINDAPPAYTPVTYWREWLWAHLIVREEANRVMQHVSVEPAGGIYREPQQIALAPVDEASPLYYTLDGSEPTSKSSRYDQPITIDRSATLKVSAIDASGNRSVTTSTTFLVDPAAPTNATTTDLIAATRAIRESQQFELVLDNWEYVVQLQPDRPKWLAERGEAHARLGHWQAAAADFSSAHEAGVKWDYWPLVGHIVLRVLLDDASGYPDWVDELLLLGDDEDKWVALWKIYAGVAADGAMNRENREALLNLIKRGLPADWNQPPKLALLMAAIEYRSGNYETAIEWAKRGDGQVPKSLEAMSHFRLGQLVQARQCLDSVNLDDKEFEPNLLWREWLFFDRLVHREAKRLLEQTPTHQ